MNSIFKWEKINMKRITSLNEKKYYQTNRIPFAKCQENIQ